MEVLRLFRQCFFLQADLCRGEGLGKQKGFCLPHLFCVPLRALQKLLVEFLHGQHFSPLLS